MPLLEQTRRRLAVLKTASHPRSVGDAWGTKRCGPPASRGSQKAGYVLDRPSRNSSSVRVAMEQQDGSVALQRNSEVNWDEFDAGSYFEHNYASIRADDREILEFLRDELRARREISKNVAVLDIGTGTNLYPLLLTLPWAGSIDAVEYSVGGVSWLRDAITSYGPEWDAYWAVLAENEPWRGVGNPRKRLAEVTSVQQGSIFDLPSDRYDFGSMFFVAESLTEDVEEYRSALHAFLGAVKPGGTIVGAFMENSTGYDVAHRPFPAVPIDEATLRDSLAENVARLVVQHLDIPDDEQLRPGYTGMLIAVGTRT